jgi:hypothetical protein
MRILDFGFEKYLEASGGRKPPGGTKRLNGCSCAEK